MKSLTEIIKNAANGDTAALEELYKATHQKLYAVAYSVLYNNSLAEDVVQDLFVDIIEKGARTFNPVFGSSITWLCKIARRKAIDVHRRIKNNPHLQFSEEILYDSSENRPFQPDKQITTEDISCGWNMEDFEDAEIFALLNKNEQIVLKFKMQKYKYDEISELTGFDNYKIGNLVKSAKKKIVNYLKLNKALKNYS